MPLLSNIDVSIIGLRLSLMLSPFLRRLPLLLRQITATAGYISHFHIICHYHISFIITFSHIIIFITPPFISFRLFSLPLHYC